MQKKNFKKTKNGVDKYLKECYHKDITKNKQSSKKKKLQRNLTRKDFRKTGRCKEIVSGKIIPNEGKAGGDHIGVCIKIRLKRSVGVINKFFQTRETRSKKQRCQMEALDGWSLMKGKGGDSTGHRIYTTENFI